MDDVNGRARDRRQERQMEEVTLLATLRGAAFMVGCAEEKLSVVGCLGMEVVACSC